MNSEMSQTKHAICKSNLEKVMSKKRSTLYLHFLILISSPNVHALLVHVCALPLQFCVQILSPLTRKGLLTSMLIFSSLGRSIVSTSSSSADSVVMSELVL